MEQNGNTKAISALSSSILSYLEANSSLAWRCSSKENSQQSSASTCKVTTLYIFICIVGLFNPYFGYPAALELRI